jgi:cytochrome c5
MKRRKLFLVLCFSGATVVALAGIAQEYASEAPAGFDTPTLSQNPGSQSVSNGIKQPAGDTYAHDQQVYEQTHDPNSGLGPVFNARSCVDCHQNPVSGAASQFTEIRVGHKDANGNFVNPTVLINDGADSIAGRSIVNDRAICPQAQEHVPATEDIRTLRAALNTLGDGFVEAIDDNTLRLIAARQPDTSDGRIHGEVIEVPVLEAPGQTRVGRFGWKNQHSSLLSFIGFRVLGGFADRRCVLRPQSVGHTHLVGLADIDHFAQFVRGTKVPPPDAVLAATPAALQGHELFRTIGCSTCHVESIVTAAPGTTINGGMFAVPAALGNKVIHPFGDLSQSVLGRADWSSRRRGLPRAVWPKSGRLSE